MSERPLPDPIAGHLREVLPEGAITPDRVRLTQKGEMVQRPGGRTLEFTAAEELSVPHRRVRVARRLRTEPPRPDSRRRSIPGWRGIPDHGEPRLSAEEFEEHLVDLPRDGEG